MVYEGTQSLNYVKNFVNGVLTEEHAIFLKCWMTLKLLWFYFLLFLQADQWQGFPITCRAPTNTIIVGMDG